MEFTVKKVIYITDNIPVNVKLVKLSKENLFVRVRCNIQLQLIYMFVFNKIKNKAYLFVEISH